MFELILPAALGLCGGGIGVAVVKWLTGRRKTNVEISGLKDNQTAEWRDSALALSKEILALRREMHEISTRMEDAEHDLNEAKEALSRCLKKVEDCNCHE